MSRAAYRPSARTGTVATGVDGVFGDGDVVDGVFGDGDVVADSDCSCELVADTEAPEGRAADFLGASVDVSQPAIRMAHDMRAVVHHSPSVRDPAIVTSQMDLPTSQETRGSQPGETGPKVPSGRGRLRILPDGGE